MHLPSNERDCARDGAYGRLSRSTVYVFCLVGALAIGLICAIANWAEGGAAAQQYQSSRSAHDVAASAVSGRRVGRNARGWEHHGFLVWALALALAMHFDPVMRPLKPLGENVPVMA